MPDNDCFGTIGPESPKIEELVFDLKADNNNCIWIATSSGTYKYNKESKKLSFYPANEYCSPRSIDLTNAGDIWVSGRDGKIYKYNARMDNFTSFEILTDKEISASVNLVNILDAGIYGLLISSDIAGTAI
jgi:ligand-binding sensor domain-containing protein